MVGGGFRQSLSEDDVLCLSDGSRDELLKAEFLDLKHNLSHVLDSSFGNRFLQLDFEVSGSFIVNFQLLGIIFLEGLGLILRERSHELIFTGLLKGNYLLFVLLLH